MIDFTNMPRRNKTYGGANGNKISVIYQDHLYMLKFPGIPRINKDMSYANGCISEYLGSHVFELAGIPVQQTLLGTYTNNGKEKIVVACRDFTSPEVVLQDFASLKNTIIGSSSNGYGTELEDILETIEQQMVMDPKILRERFWDMFIVDALIGNWDRHNGNWGFLYNPTTDETILAPVFDCGSSLYPQADETIMQNVLKDPAEKDARIFDRPLSGIKKDGQKINYYHFISSLKNKECNDALKRIVPRVTVPELVRLVEETPFIGKLQREFYQTMLLERREKILQFSLDRLLKRERRQMHEAR